MSCPLPLAPEESRRFSLPLPVRLLGERQEVFGLGSVAVATDLRIEFRVLETSGDFRIQIGDPQAGGSAQRGGLIRTWRELLAEITPGGREGLIGLTLEVNARGSGFPVTADALLRSPAFAVGAVSAVRALRGDAEQAEPEEIARCAARLLGAVHPSRSPLRERFCAEALVCIQGGARYVEPTGEAIDVQQLVPPDALLLAIVPGLCDDVSAEAQWEERLLEALQRAAATVPDLVASSEGDMEDFFHLASQKLDEGQTGVLYGLLRVHQLVLAFLENLSRPVFDHDILAEMCDEEDAVMEQYFGFRPSRYGELRREAFEAGALGSKYSYGWGCCPFLIIIAPGRRELLQDRLPERFKDAVLLSANVDPAGIRPE